MNFYNATYDTKTGLIHFLGIDFGAPNYRMRVVASNQSGQELYIGVKLKSSTYWSGMFQPRSHSPARVDVYKVDRAGPQKTGSAEVRLELTRVLSVPIRNPLMGAVGTQALDLFLEDKRGRKKRSVERAWATKSR